MNLQAYIKAYGTNCCNKLSTYCKMTLVFAEKKINVGLYGSQNMSMFWLRKLQTNKVSQKIMFRISFHVPSQGHYGFPSFRLLTDFFCLYTYEF